MVGRVRMTEKDTEIVALIERWGFMSVGELCRFLKLKPTAVKWRLARLLEHDLLRRQKTMRGFFYVPVEHYPKIDLTNYDHDLTAKYLALYLSEKNDCEYLTLREMRRAAMRDDGAGALTRKIPDFVLVRDRQRAAIEVELSPKPLDRLRKLISNYMESILQKEFIQVQYYCGSQAIQERVFRIITEKGAGQWITAVMLPDEVRP